MSTVVLANIVSFVGCILMVSIGFIKNREKILIVQCIQLLIMGISNLILGGITAFVANMLSVVRNVYSLRCSFTLPVKLLFITAQIIIAVPFNELGLLGWLPIIAAVSFTMFLDVEDEIMLKLVIIFGSVMWLIFDLSLRNYTAFTFDIFTILSTCIGIWRLVRDRKSNSFVSMPRLFSHL